MNTVVNHKLKDILPETGKQVGKTQRHENAEDLTMRLLGGRVRGKQSRCAARRKSAEANKLGQ